MVQVPCRGGDSVRLSNPSLSYQAAMEDAHTTILDLNNNTSSDTHVSFFAVFDGHGGPSVAQYVGEKLHGKVAGMPAYKVKDYKEALRTAFFALDDDITNDERFRLDLSGCTAVTCLVDEKLKLYVANVGDSRIIMSTNGEANAISIDHKPSNEIEQQRIVNAGGYVEAGRVNGNLALSRAFGDLEFKKNAQLPPAAQAVTVDPELFEIQLSEQDDMLVLACDGIWDCMSNQEVIDFLKIKVADTGSLMLAVEALMDHCLAAEKEFLGIGCDNMTVIAIALLHGKTKTEWIDKIKQDTVKHGLVEKVRKLEQQKVDRRSQGSPGEGTTEPQEDQLVIELKSPIFGDPDDNIQ